MKKLRMEYGKAVPGKSRMNTDISLDKLNTDGSLPQIRLKGTGAGAQTSMHENKSGVKQGAQYSTIDSQSNLRSKSVARRKPGAELHRNGIKSEFGTYSQRSGVSQDGNRNLRPRPN